MAEVCFICDKSLLEGETVVVERGLDTLKQSSVERKDGKDTYLGNVSSVTIHKQCRKDYTRRSSIPASKRQRDEASTSTTPSPPHSRMRSNEPRFSFKNLCIFCGEEANEEKEKKKKINIRRKIHHVSTLSFKDTVLQLAEQRNDDVSKAISRRISYEHDLVAAEARYHSDCFKDLMKPTIGGTAGRPGDDKVSSAMDQIYSFIENNDECQFTLNELKDVCKDYVPDEKTIKSKLVHKYGKKIIITTKSTTLTIIYFTNTQYDILNKSWYDNRKHNEAEERLRILKTAAAIIREDIRSVVVNNENYPPPAKMLENMNDEIPYSLTFFVEKIILKNRRYAVDRLKLKCTAISHAILTAVRPRLFISQLQLGLSIFCHRRFGSKRLIDVLSSFGMCASYKETVRYESVTVHHPQPFILPPETGAFLQHAADNADINVCTLDGYNTLHIMGIIQIITPASAIAADKPIARSNVNLSAKDIAAKAKVPVQIYENKGVVGLSKITAENIVDENITVSMLRKVDILWMYGKWSDISELPGWNGYIERLTMQYNNFSTSRILFLPFIHQPASNYNTVYSTLLCALENGKKYGHEACIITFDQPLYAKAREIVAAASEELPLSKIIVRLGGFHLIMSYLGSIRYIMQGSGLKEALSVIYAPNSVDKMLNGHAYARAVRGHSLLHLALATIISKDITINEDLEATLRTTIDDVINGTVSYDDIKNSDKNAEDLLNKFNISVQECEQRGPTSKLWVQYFRMVSIAKEYIRAERMEDRRAHLNSIKRMLPYFHASGHYPYAKSAHLYLQDMIKLEQSVDPLVFQKFITGFFTARRSDKFSCGTWSDMIIEQSLMKSMKTDGGVARGRSTQESVLSKWVYGMHAMISVSEGLEVLTNVSMDTTDQHIDARDSRIKRDNEDVKKLIQWFSCYNPFPIIPKIISISSGVVGDDKINCHNAYEVGLVSVTNMIGQKFDSIKLKRADRVLPLLTVSSSVKVHNEEVPIDPLLLFQRISITKRFDEQLQKFLEYELAPFQLSLFDENGMRKNQKSAIYKCFEPVNVELDSSNATYIVDGGFLLHRVVWNKGDTFDIIFNAYVHYVLEYYGHNVIIVFDGYNDHQKNIKAAEQRRRSAKVSPFTDILFDESMTASMSQEKFLGNANNKHRFISMLSKKFGAANINIKQAPNDADVLIIETAIEESERRTSIVVGEDVDLLVLLIARTPIDKLIYFLKPEEAKNQTKIYSSQSLSFYPQCKNHILFLHAITGCDTTSAIFHRGKINAFKLLEKNKDLIKYANVFNEEQCSPDVVINNGIRFLLAMYKAPIKEISIDNHRYLTFAKLTQLKKPVDLSSLPPTCSAAQQHLFRVYYQVQVWLGNEVNPVDWGWALQEGILEPIKTLLPPAPDNLLNTIFCNCTRGCTLNCGCRKVGLHCSPVCGNCHGQDCLNVSPEDDEEIEMIAEMESEGEQ